MHGKTPSNDNQSQSVQEEEQQHRAQVRAEQANHLSALRSNAPNQALQARTAVPADCALPKLGRQLPPDWTAQQSEGQTWRESPLINRGPGLRAARDAAPQILAIAPRQTRQRIVPPSSSMPIPTGEDGAFWLAFLRSLTEGSVHLQEGIPAGMPHTTTGPKTSRRSASSHGQREW